MTIGPPTLDQGIDGEGGPGGPQPISGGLDHRGGLQSLSLRAKFQAARAAFLWGDSFWSDMIWPLGVTWYDFVLEITRCVLISIRSHANQLNSGSF